MKENNRVKRLNEFLKNIVSGHQGQLVINGQNYLVSYISGYTDVAHFTPCHLSSDNKLSFGQSQIKDIDELLYDTQSDDLQFRYVDQEEWL